MFERFIKNENCMKILFWLINHSVADYEASLIAFDCGIHEVGVFMTTAVILQELKIIVIDDSADTLRIMLNEDCEFVKKFVEMKELFDEEAYSSSEVSAAFVALGEFSQSTSSSITNMIGNRLIDAMLSEIDEYKTNDNKENLDERLLKYKQLDEEDDLDGFEEFLQNLK